MVLILKLGNIFNSFSRLDIKYKKILPVIRTLHRCDLAKDYYLDKLTIYCPERDPMNKKYQPYYSSYYKNSKITNNIVGINSPVSRTNLIRDALALARRKGIKAPYLKGMDDGEIQRFIRSNS
jgi:hypothetical protein